MANNYSVKKLAKNIKLLVLDVDGVLTDGTINIGNDGEIFKSFNVRDGLGIKLLQDAGIQVAICTGRTSQIVAKRAEELGITQVMQGQKDKREGLSDICSALGITLQETAYMGDDIPDLCLFDFVGLSAAPADANPLAVEEAKWVSSRKGGKGAVRELAEYILKAQGKFKETVKNRFNIEI